MSKRRPSHRDRLEREYLSACRQRSELDGKILQMQTRLDRIESPRLQDGKIETGPRKDALAFVDDNKMTTYPTEFLEDGPINEVAEESDEIDWKARCIRMTALATGLLRRVAYAKTRPRLEAFAGLYALGIDCESMRTVAIAEEVSIEWVSQKAEEVRALFNLPKNQHNKSDQAARSYSESAKLQAMA